MIHEAYTKSEIAVRYYNVKYPDRNYSKQEAIKQFSQDKSIDKKTLRSVIDTIYAEQKKLLSAYAS